MTAGEYFATFAVIAFVSFMGGMLLMMDTFGINDANAETISTNLIEGCGGEYPTSFNLTRSEHTILCPDGRLITFQNYVVD